MRGQDKYPLRKMLDMPKWFLLDEFLHRYLGWAGYAGWWGYRFCTWCDRRLGG